MNLKQFYTGRAIGSVIVVAIVVCGYAMWSMLSYSFTHVPPPADRTWSEYKNKELGFAISYPSDIAHPYAVVHPPSPDGIFPGADEVRFYDAQEQHMYISLWIQQTKAKDPDGWFKEPTDRMGRAGISRTAIRLVE